MALKNHKATYTLHGASTLTEGLLNSVLVVLDALITGGMMLLLNHSKKRLARLSLRHHQWKWFSSSKTTRFIPLSLYLDKNL